VTRNIVKHFSKKSNISKLNHPAITRIFGEGMFKASTGKKYPFAMIEYVPTTARTLMVGYENAPFEIDARACERND